MKELLIDQFFVRVFDESFYRIQLCLEKLTEDEVWKRPNESSNSVGNLVLHLLGNGEQWIFSGLLYEPNTRERDLEFLETSQCPKKELLSRMDQFEAKCRKTLSNNLDFKSVRRVQVFDETGVSILVHVIEHMSYHTGQIALITKLIRNRDLGFYDHLENLG